MNKMWMMTAWVVVAILCAGQYLLAGTTPNLPEPSSLLLLAAGAGAIGMWRRQRSKNDE